MNHAVHSDSFVPSNDWQYQPQHVPYRRPDSPRTPDSPRILRSESSSNSFSFDEEEQFIEPEDMRYAAKYAQNNNVSQWLHISQLLKQLNGRNICNDSLSEILSIVGFDTAKFIRFLYENKEMNEEQLMAIHGVLVKDMNQGNIEYSSEATSLFSTLSTASITNICAFLTRSDIASFKRTSTQIAIECLNEIKKISIAVFNMNELRLHSDYKHLALLNDQKTEKIMKMERYFPSTKLKKIQTIWAKNYGINVDDLIVIRFDGDCIYETDDLLVYFNRSILKFRYFTQMLSHKSSQCHLVDNRTTNLSIGSMQKDFFLVFDRTQMIDLYEEDEKEEKKAEETIYFDESKQWQCKFCTFINLLRYKSCEMCGHLQNETEFTLPKHVECKRCVVLLYYFDLRQQQITFCKALIVHKDFKSEQMKKFIADNLNKLIQSDRQTLEMIKKCEKNIKNYNVLHETQMSVVRLSECENKIFVKSNVEQIASRKVVSLVLFQINISKRTIATMRQVHNETFHGNPNNLLSISIEFAAHSLIFEQARSQKIEVGVTRICIRLYQKNAIERGNQSQF